LASDMGALTPDGPSGSFPRPFCPFA